MFYQRNVPISLLDAHHCFEVVDLTRQVMLRSTFQWLHSRNKLAIKFKFRFLSGEWESFPLSMQVQWRSRKKTEIHLYINSPRNVLLLDITLICSLHGSVCIWRPFVPGLCLKAPGLKITYNLHFVNGNFVYMSNLSLPNWRPIHWPLTYCKRMILSVSWKQVWDLVAHGRNHVSDASLIFIGRSRKSRSKIRT